MFGRSGRTQIILDIPGRHGVGNQRPGRLLLPVHLYRYSLSRSMDIQMWLIEVVCMLEVQWTRRTVHIAIA